MTDTERERINAICEVAGVAEIDDLSDGFHTFRQLYYQRMMLFATIVNQNKDRAWKSLRHEDGELCFSGGWFIVGIDTPVGSYAYHYENKYFDMFDCQILDCGKHWDGHTEKDVTRLLSLQKAQLSQEGTTSDAINKTETVEHLRRVLEATVPNTDYDEGYIDGIEFGISTVSTMPTIQPVATDINVGDTISRQAAVELAMKYCPDDDVVVQCDGDIRELLDELENLPSAQPERKRYRHYKGGIYEIICEAAHHTERAESLVIYRNVKTGGIWARPDWMFYGYTEDGKKRFEEVADE